ncbi:hypothetical protein L873DRAFT_1798144 [Choiromyces venosus 120613-1]|uniref:Uncharacterized protein n=1 Tax=Choiromyces venosus 120613-1 TaxID=1336337 RepID=A0A3N4K471_9PEZI|nr:hypothetical protein L873DRAFT_1798144 [Choiromyces venosus 120613-1]
MIVPPPKIPGFPRFFSEKLMDFGPSVAFRMKIRDINQLKSNRDQKSNLSIERNKTLSERKKILLLEVRGVSFRLEMRDTTENRLTRPSHWSQRGKRSHLRKKSLGSGPSIIIHTLNPPYSYRVKQYPKRETKLHHPHLSLPAIPPTGSSNSIQ